MIIICADLESLNHAAAELFAAETRQAVQVCDSLPLHSPWGSLRAEHMNF
ncbi:MAG: hypothetical protein PHH28_13600 [Desulfuromonadaceae bacterium]|nr:hypothetical protein [Desulfuromonadaceae bacterium]